MKIFITRDTGFYGMGSPLEIVVDGKKRGFIGHQQTISLDIPQDAKLQVRFSLLRSSLFKVKNLKENAHLKIVFNPRFLRLTIFMYLVPIIAVLALRNLIILGLFLLIAIICLVSFAKQAYLIKEDKHV